MAHRHGVHASVFRYPLRARHPAPLDALRGEIRRQRAEGAHRVGLVGFSAGGHLAGLAALATGAAPDETAQFAVLGYAITPIETETYRPSRLIPLGEGASPELRRSTSLDALVTPQSPPFFGWHTAEDRYVPPEHTYRLATAPGAPTLGVDGGRNGVSYVYRRTGPELEVRAELRRIRRYAPTIDDQATAIRSLASLGAASRSKMFPPRQWRQSIP